MAARLLRSSILQPIINADMLKMRLDAVEALINNEDQFDALKRALKSIQQIDVDKLITSVRPGTML